MDNLQLIIEKYHLCFLLVLIIDINSFNISVISFEIDLNSFSDI